MELSIAILVYQFSPLKVVHELVRQARLMNINFELLIFDDGSGDTWQKELDNDFGDIPEVSLHLNPINLGRSTARNRLASKCLGAFILMIDGDNPVDNPNFVNDYYQVRKAKSVVVGGRSIMPEPLPGCELRWTFAKNREVKSLKERQANPYGHFQTNCFLIDRKVFEKVRFEEELLTYGYEDNLFGFSLEKAGVNIIHIENPQLHKAEDRNLVFLAKSAEAMRSLFWIYTNRPLLQKHFKLLRVLKFLKGAGLTGLVLAFLNLMEKGLKRNLDSSGPSLWRFDLYRLQQLLLIDRG